MGNDALRSHVLRLGTYELHGMYERQRLVHHDVEQQPLRPRAAPRNTMTIENAGWSNGPSARLVLAWLLLIPAPLFALSFRTTTTTTLPEGTIARDVRWAGPSEVYVSTGQKGVVRTSVTSAGTLKSMAPPDGQSAIWISGLVGAGQRHLFIATPLGTAAWFRLDGNPRPVRERSFLTIMDIDARGDAAAILGSDRGPLRGLSRDGTIAWLGSLSKDLSDLRPLMRGQSKPGAKDMARCSILETGAIRFMQDGSIVVLPGAEPGMYRYAANGKLIETWPTEALGIVDDCALPDSELHLIARDFKARLDWYAARIIVDDILPLSTGPALLLRRVEKNVTTWDLVTFPYGGGRSERIRLPLSVASPGARVRGDVRGNEIVLLVFDDPLPRQKPVAPPKLVVLSKSK